VPGCFGVSTGSPVATVAMQMSGDSLARVAAAGAAFRRGPPRVAVEAFVRDGQRPCYKLKLLRLG
jgi:hypothetical protein